MDPIKNSFSKVRQDINYLENKLNFLKDELKETREKLIEICEIIKFLNEKLEKQEVSPVLENKTQIFEKQTTPTHTSTNKTYFKPLYTQNLPISTGNEGVSTDRQTDRQTDKNTQNTQENPSSQTNSINNAIDILDSLDNLKKEIRLKFKRLTEQEMSVFSTIYALDNEIGYSDYKLISEKLNLTESSIRDYVRRIIKKGIPVEKKRVNNKNIQLNISNNLKKITSLNTIIQLRGI